MHPSARCMKQAVIMVGFTTQYTSYNMLPSHQPSPTAVGKGGGVLARMQQMSYFDRPE